MKFILILLLGLLNSCAVGPNYRRPNLPIPTKYTKEQTLNQTKTSSTTIDKSQHFFAGKELPPKWWELFHSNALNAVVESSLHHNPTVYAAEAALESSLETAFAQRGAFFPFIGASFMPSTQQTAKILTSVLASNNYKYALYTGQLFVTYTPDVFGGTRRQMESLIAEARMTRFQRDAVYLSLTTNVVYAAIQEAALRDEIATSKKLIRSYQKLLAIYERRYQAGDAAIINITQQKAALATVEATLPPFEKQLALEQNLLSALTGQYAACAQIPHFHLKDFTLPSVLPLSVPSKLLEHRPDIRAAEEQMHAANARIGVAIANRLPNVSIGFTNMGLTATTMLDLFTPGSRFWSLAGIIAQPIFDAGTLYHKQRAAIANYKQTAALYRATIINAFQNVADTLEALKWDTNTLHDTYKAEHALFVTLHQSKQQVLLGDLSELNMLFIEQNYLQAHLVFIQTQANRLSDTVALFQALGGGLWQELDPASHATVQVKLAAIK